jgi:hypothetical protein
VQRLGVVVDSSRCGKVVHGGAVLGVVMGRSEGSGRHYAVARWWHYGGGGAPYIATRGGGRRAAKPGAGKRQWGSHGCGKAAAATV